MATKVYLSVPIIGGRDLESARQIAHVIERLGHQVISSWVLSPDPGLSLPAKAVYFRDTEAIKRCDALVAEVSFPSHGVGMEIMLAHVLGKKVVCLRKPNSRLSKLVMGMPGAEIIEYDSPTDLEEKLRDLL
ncbi:MAG: nucleoside 2-deoxyribosyltransferase [Candidatus Brockarchaeota archaeon]|nr:nucleoside 2-deoxyribosyltransferase [Candidatus Brockarchaeota archaeon]